MKQLLMGNEAIAMGAIRAGVNLVCGYPGTPSTEVLETAAKKNDGSYYIEWSVNEKAALEVAAGASYAGARTLVTMKQVGLNVASDPIMSLSYVGIKGSGTDILSDRTGYKRIWHFFKNTGIRSINTAGSLFDDGRCF